MWWREAPRVDEALRKVVHEAGSADEIGLIHGLIAPIVWRRRRRRRRLVFFKSREAHRRGGR
jgi:hypothetical protein